MSSTRGSGRGSGLDACLLAPPPASCALRACRLSRGVGGAVLPDYTVDLPPVPAPAGDDPAYVDSPLGTGRALVLPTGVGLGVSAPDGQPLANEVEGTIEMWVRDARPHDDLHNRSLLRIGALHLYRRIGVGTYLYIGAAGHQTGMVLPPGRWAHLAATWRPSTKEEGATEVAPTRRRARRDHLQSAHQSKSGWAGPELVIPADANAGLFIDELRVSDVARYEGSFATPMAAFEPDAHTIVLAHFDGDRAARVRGQEVEFQER